MITRFGLLRHANTLWNQEKRIQGQDDSSLTEEGKAQAEKWGRRLKAYPWDLIIASDLGRTAHTATLVNKNLRVQLAYDPRLREQDWGTWTGKTLAKLKEDTTEPLSRQEAAGWEFCPPGGESRNRVWERSQNALLSAAEKWPGNRILVVTHEGVIKCLIYRICGRKFLPSESPLLRTGHLHRLIHDRGRLGIEKKNAMELL